MMIAQGSPTAQLTEAEIRDLFERSLAANPLDGKRVLVIIPDHTRSGPTGMFFRVISDALLKLAAKIDFLIALGTHPTMPEDKINQLLDITSVERRDRYARVNV